MNREVRKKMKAAKEDWTEEQSNNIEKGVMSEHSKEAYNTLKVLTTTLQHQSAVIEDSIGDVLTESTVVLNWWSEYCSGLCHYELLPAYSRVTRPAHKRLKVYLC